MKTSRYITGLALFAGLSFFSCSKSFLDRPALGALTPDLVPTADGVRGLLVGAYADLDGQRGAINGAVASISGGGPWEAAPSNWIYGSVAGGDAHKGSTVTDQPPMNAIMTGAFTADNGFFNSKWISLFDGVVRVNNTLNALAQVNTPGLDAGEATSIKAEARFLRGHYYFELRKFFQLVPWIDETTTDPKQPNTDTAALWKHIEDDFKFAYDSLGDLAWKGDAGRANKWAAASYLAKTYIYENKYAEAQQLLEKICGISQDGGDAAGKNALGAQYKLVNYADNFDADKKNNAETVFDVQMSANNGSNQITRANQGDMLNFPYSSPFNCCGFYQPSQDLVNSFKVNPANGLPILSGYNTPSIVNDQNVAADANFALDINTPVDPRLDWTVGRRGVPYLDWGPHRGVYYIRDQAYAGPYSPKKNVYRHATADKYYDAHAWAPGTAINVHIMRYADILLLAAEAEAKQNNLAQATIYVNRVRARAANPAGWVSINDNRQFAKATTNSQAAFDAAVAANTFAVGDWIVRTELNETWQILASDANNKPTKFNKYGVPKYQVGLYPVFSDPGQAMQAIMFERKLELGMEGQRFFDLARWGTIGTVSQAYFAFEKGIASDLSAATQTTRRYFPIPQRQIDLSVVNGQPTLTQNTGN